MIKVENLSVTIRKKEILKDISFCIKPNSLTFIIGKNGSGKSTLLSALNSTVKYTGKITFCGRSPTQMSLKEKAGVISFLPQQLPGVPITCRELAEMGRTPYLGIGQKLNEGDMQAVDEAVRIAGVTHLQDKRADRISGGEKQKAYLSMILSQQSSIVTLDEPVTYLDTEHRKEVYALMKTLKAEYKKTVVAVTHDITVATEEADNIIFLDNGKLIFYGSAEECIESGLIESVFKVKKYTYDADGDKRILYK